MPLVDISGEEAFAIRDGNPEARWGDRATMNRVEPLATPRFEAPFRIQPGESVFTVGSCFARNVEDEMMRRGFSVAARKLLKTPPFEGISQVALNNYGTPSIYNEFALAFGVKPCRLEDHIAEIEPGRFVDFHFSPAVPPSTWDVAVARRQALAEMYRSAAQCRLIVMTLGLAECWFDTKTGQYLNLTPRDELIRQHHGRFRMHVLSFEETYQYIDDTMKLLQERCQHEMRLLLTVSPVPLSATHRNQDVIVANCYSKSVLRAVAETICAKYPFVTYFPSYESVIHSDRQLAFHADLIHVTDELVQVNVARMIDAFVGYESEEKFTSAAMATYRASQANFGKDKTAIQFFRRHAKAWVKQSREFALESAQFLYQRRQWDKALQVLRKQKGLRVTTLTAACLIRSGKDDEALAILEAAAPGAYRARSMWHFTIDAAMSADNPQLVSKIFSMYSSHQKAGIFVGNKIVDYFKKKGLVEEVQALYRVANEPRRGPLLRKDESEIEESR